jgi:hypothetical protein
LKKTRSKKPRKTLSIAGMSVMSMMSATFYSSLKQKIKKKSRRGIENSRHYGHYGHNVNGAYMSRKNRATSRGLRVIAKARKLRAEAHARKKLGYDRQHYDGHNIDTDGLAVMEG